MDLKLPYPTSLDGINMALSLHSEQLAAIIKALKDFDLSKVDSYSKFVDDFRVLKTSLKAKIEEITKGVDTQTNLSAALLANPATTSIAFGKIMIPLGPLPKLIAEISAAAKLLGFIAKIVTQYVTLVSTIAIKIAEVAAAAIAIGLETVKKFLADALNMIKDYILKLKKKAINAVKQMLQDQLLPPLEKKQIALKNAIDSKKDTEGNSLTDEVLQETKRQLQIVEFQLRWLADKLKLEEV